jgi:thiol-disulfide isomerase/thioredoxin
MNLRKIIDKEAITASRSMNSTRVCPESPLCKRSLDFWLERIDLEKEKNSLKLSNFDLFIIILIIYISLSIGRVGAMKKFFPLFIFSFLLIFALVSDLFFDTKGLNAQQMSKSKERNTLYEKLYNELTFKTISGERILLKNQKAPVVIINFWASWCAPCLKEFPKLIELVSKFPKSKLLILGINTDDSLNMKQLKKKIKSLNLNFSSVADVDGAITSKFHVTKIPVSIIFKDGKVQEVTNGEKDFLEKSLINLIQ